VHHCDDDGGHAFAFFWHPVADPPGPEWHDDFRSALAIIAAAIA
jgi:hypothetical protein